MQRVRDANAGKDDALVRLGYAWDKFGTATKDEATMRDEKQMIRFVSPICSEPSPRRAKRSATLTQSLSRTQRPGSRSHNHPPRRRSMVAT